VEPSGEEGSLLVEVVVTAALLVTLGLGLLLALDTASARSAEARLRAQALAVAQSELDLLRTRPYNDLRTLSAAPRTVTNAGREFTVTTALRAVTQADAPAGCSVRRSRDALEATIAVGWASLGAREPVRLTTVVSAPVGAGGGLVATVRDAADAPVAGLPVTLAGAGGTAVSTDAAGCARWDNLAARTDHTIVLGRPGWVSPQGEEQVARTLTVGPEAMSTTAFAYDRAGAVQLRFRALRREPRTGLVSTVASRPPQIAFDNASVDPVVRLPRWGEPLVAAAGATAAGIEVGALFPFPATGYAVFAGACEAARPPQGAPALEVLVPRGEVARSGTQAHELRLPSLDLRVTNGGAPVPAGTTLEIRSCGAPWDPGRPVAADGTLSDPGVPYGRVGLCVTAPGPGGGEDGEATATVRQAWREVDVTAAGEPPLTTLALGGARCP